MLSSTLAPITGLGVIYLLAVLLLAVRRGEPAALVTAFLSVLALNYFFIEPRHRLTIADSEYVVALIVFLIVAIVVGRLAATARQRATEAERRASEAAAREAEVKILAAAASAVLESDLESQLASLEESVHRASAGKFRIEMRSAPSRTIASWRFRWARAAAPGGCMDRARPASVAATSSAWLSRSAGSSMSHSSARRWWSTRRRPR